MTQTPLVSDLPPATNSPARPPVFQDQVPLWRSIFVLALGILIWGVYRLDPPVHVSPQPGVVMHLPGYVNVAGGLTGENGEISEAEHTILPKDTEFARKSYLDYATHTQILCSIVLSGAAQQSIHRPEVCLIAQGWTISGQEDIAIPLQSGHTLTVRNLTIKRDINTNGHPVTLTEYNMYWFVGENVTTASHFMRIFLSSWDRIVHNRAHRWAYVTVASLINKNIYPHGRDAEQTRAMLVAFIQQIVPTFQKNEMPAGS
jgi:hypothetical protein